MSAPPTGLESEQLPVDSLTVDPFLWKKMEEIKDCFGARGHGLRCLKSGGWGTAGTTQGWHLSISSDKGNDQLRKQTWAVWMSRTDVMKAKSRGIKGSGRAGVDFERYTDWKVSDRYHLIMVLNPLTSGQDSLYLASLSVNQSHSLLNAGVSFRF